MKENRNRIFVVIVRVVLLLIGVGCAVSYEGYTKKKEAVRKMGQQSGGSLLQKKYLKRRFLRLLPGVLQSKAGGKKILKPILKEIWMHIRRSEMYQRVK